jgi:hypothetical protein
MMTVWPLALTIWSIQASTVAFSAGYESMWVKNIVVTVVLFSFAVLVVVKE